MEKTNIKARKFPRYLAKQRALVLVNQAPDALPFHIVDISKGGLAFRYLGQQLKCPDSLQINLYHESTLVIKDIPVKPISDLCIDSNPISLRRGSLSFGILSTELAARIDDFIKTYSEKSLCEEC